MKRGGMKNHIRHSVLTVLLLAGALPFKAMSQTDITSLSSISSDKSNVPPGGFSRWHK